MNRRIIMIAISILSMLDSSDVAAAVQPVRKNEVRSFDLARLKDLKTTKQEFTPGLGSVNGTRVPLVVSTGGTDVITLLKALRSELDGEFTVTDEVSEFGLSILVADIYSSTCLRCMMPTHENFDDILRKSVVITVTPLPGHGSMTVGSSSGPLLSLNRSVPAYRGVALKSLLHEVSRAEVAYTFGRGAFYGYQAHSRRDLANLDVRFATDLEAAGFSPVSPYRANAELLGSGGEAAVIERLWAKDQTVVSYRLKSKSDGTDIQVSESTMMNDRK